MKSLRTALFALVTLLGLGTVVQAAVNIELRPERSRVQVNDTVRIGIYLVSDDATTQTASAADIIFGWDTAKLQFLGCDNTGGTASTFTGLDNHPLNEASPPADGNGHVLFLGQFGTPTQCTPAGTLLTTLQFKALAATDATTINVLASQGNYISKVISGTVPGLYVTGTLGSAQVAIQNPNGPRG